MARLPTPGGDDGTWGKVLNTFLGVEHNSDGSLKNVARPSDVSAKYTKPAGGIPESDLASAVQTKLDNTGNATKLQGVDVSSGAPSDGEVLQYNSGSSAWVPATVTGSGSVSDATTSTKGILQLAGDLGGTAALPTVPGLANKADDSAVVHNTGAETVAGVKTFSSSPVVPTPANGTDAANKSYVDTAVSGAGGQLTVEDEGSTLTSAATSLNFTGAGVTATNNSGAVTVNIPGGGGGSGDFVFTVVQKSASYTPNDGEFVVVSGTSAGINITLPTASNGARIRVGYLTGTNAVLVKTVVGSTSVSFNTVGQTQEFYCDGTNWWGF